MVCMKSVLRASCAGTFLFTVVTGCAALQEPPPQTSFVKSAPALTSVVQSAPALTSAVSVSPKRSRSVARSSSPENLEVSRAVYTQVEVVGDPPPVVRPKAVVVSAVSHAAPRAQKILPPPITIAAAPPTAAPTAAPTATPTPIALAPLKVADVPKANPESIATATPSPAPASESVPARAPRNDAVFSSLEDESRFHDVIINSDAYAMGADRRIQPYAVLHSSADSRSSANGVTPIIYNDNAEIISGGARYHLGNHSGAFLFAEAGEGFSLVGKGDHPDLRYGWDSWSEHGSESRAHTSYGYSAAYYSRYDGDVIGYGTILHDFPVRRGIRGVIGINGALDDHRAYYNNIGEIEAGIQAGTSHLQLRLLGVAGTYLSRGVGIPISRPYTSFRPTIFWAQALK
jgi:hypothetical protein